MSEWLNVSLKTHGGMQGSQDLGILPIHKCLCKKQLGFAMFEQFRGQNADNLLTKNDMQKRQLLVCEAIGILKSPEAGALNIQSITLCCT